MAMRQLSISNKKVRGVPRRLRSLKKWAESFEGYFPTSGLSVEEGYWNLKIPVLMNLVQGKQAKKEIQASCAQRLIDAAYHLFQAKKDTSPEIKVTCCIILPDMFASELCIFTSREYFNMHTVEGYGRFGKLERIKNKSLVQLWGLKLPSEFSELGILRTDKNEDGNPYLSENWYFGEI